jgi:hypothetical protein
MTSPSHCFIDIWDRAGTCLMRSSCPIIDRFEISIVLSSPSTFVFNYYIQTLYYFTFY